MDPPQYILARGCTGRSISRRANPGTVTEFPANPAGHSRLSRVCGLPDILSEPTGGRTFRVTRKTPLGAIFDDIGEEMRNQYGLEFAPPAGGREGEFLKLEVKSTMAGVKAQARSGYYSGRK